MSVPTRRAFLASAAASTSLSAAPQFVSQRPDPSKRRFTSEAVEATIAEVRKSIADPELGWLFENCFPNTLDTTVDHGELNGKPDTFVITGDIDAMWLRDSTAQVWPYLPLAKRDPKLQRLLAGVVHRQTRCVLIDPYANAFNKGPAPSPWSKDLTAMKPELHERKWEIDSLCYTVRLAHGYWKATSDQSIFTPEWKQAAALIVRTFREQQRLDGPGPYKFQRSSPVSTDSLPNGGYGNPAKPNGLIRSGFRPSDDACVFPYLIPSNFFAVTSLGQLAEIHTALGDAESARQCRELAAAVSKALAAHATAVHPKHGKIFCYEVDGYGGVFLSDDCGVPGLVSLPYLGCVPATDPVYRNTRAFCLSDSNQFYFSGKAGAGLGGPHSGLDMIWPMGIIARALTSSDESEIGACLKLVKATHAGTGFMHESFHKDDPSKFTRKWFAWANTLFGELILTVRQRHPRLLA
ncbi:MAG TPA: glycoside hydrolase family 125 protein [Bryobacteraceae bacterium]|nr:glycoside hydrolase family 125 protein [Bryobacteraceae bacterium]HPT25468.1 glycoside hydrolase family 125 protein [Bryobacteraceae bacterium]